MSAALIVIGLCCLGWAATLFLLAKAVDERDAARELSELLMRRK